MSAYRLIAALRLEIAELRKEVAELKAQPVIHHHHTASPPTLLGPQYPPATLPMPRYPYQRPWCGVSYTGGQSTGQPGYNSPDAMCGLGGYGDPLLGRMT